ncbi:MAG: DUF4160 domain-containing protein [Lachnospiraceae bacterium]|nr:DUF4160 domain-containing protein [Lachnospiraceae bacterium]
MPQVFRVGSYWVFFWTNEGEPMEPVHVHISEGAPQANATKVWITKSGKCILSNNNSKIPEKTLRSILRIIEARSGMIIRKWQEYFGETDYYC